MRFFERRLPGYGLALVASLLALFLRLALVRAVGQLPHYITFYPAVMLVAVLFGFGPGLLATIASAVAADYLVLPPLGNPGIDSLADATGLLLFVTMGLLMSGVAELYRRARQRAAEEEGRRRAGEDWEQTFDTVPDLLALLDNQHRIVRANRTMAARLGLKPEQCIGLPCYTAVHGLDAPHPACPHSQTCQDGQVHVAELHEPRLGGDFLVSTSPRFDTQGRLIGAIHVARDITQRKREEQALARQNRTLKALGDSSQAMMRARDEASYLRDACRIVAEDCGHALVWIGDVENDEARSVRPVAHAGFEEGYLETLKITWADTERGRGPTGTAVRTGQVRMCRNMLTDPQFQPWRQEALARGYASSIALPLKADGKVFGALTIYSREPDPFSADEVRLLSELADDLSYGITALRLRQARAQAEATLRDAELRYRTVANNTYDWEFWRDPEGRFLYCSPSCQRITGHRAEEFVADADLPARLIHPDDRPRFDEHLRDVEQQHLVGEAEWRCLRPDGTCRWVAHVCQPVFDEQGNYCGCRGSDRDITERKEAEETLRQSEARRKVTEAVETERKRLFEVLETIPAMVCLLTADHHVAFANRSFREKFGDSGGRRCYEYCFGRSAPCEFCESYEVLKTGQPHRWEVKTPDGGVIDAYDFPFTDVDGSPMILEMDIDITERRKTEAELERHRHHLEELVQERTSQLEASNAKLELLSEVSGQLLQSAEPQKVVETLCRKVMQHLDCHLFVNYLVDKAARRLHLNAWAGLSDQAAQAITWLDFGQAICGRVAQTGEHMVTENIRESCDPRADLVRSFGIQAYACHPLTALGRVIGTLSFGTRSRAHFRDDELALMKTVADQVAVAVQRLLAQQELQELNQSLEKRVAERTTLLALLHEVASAANRAATLEEAVQLTLRRVGQQHGWAFGLAVAPDPHDPERLIRLGPVYESNPGTSAKAGALLQQHVRRRGAGALARALESARAEWTTDLEAHMAPERAAAARAAGFQTLLAFPVLVGEETVALLEFFSDQAVPPEERALTAMASIGMQLGQVAERERATSELRRAGAYNRSLLEASLDPLLTIAPDGKITDVNAETEKVTGLSRRVLIGTDFSNYFTEPAKARAGYEQAFREGLVRDYPLQVRHTDGRHTPVLYNASVYRGPDGQVLGVFAAARDITERKRAEEAVQHERQRLHDVLEMLPVYVILLSPDYHVPFANRFFRQRFGDSHGQRCFEYLFQRQEPCDACETYKVLKTNQPLEWEWAGPDGQDYHVFDYPVTDADGSPLIMEVGVDITARKRAELGLRRLNEELEQRVAARTAELQASNQELEAFAYSVSHDLRAPLRAMDGFSQALLEDYGDKLDPDGRSHLQRVRAASQRMGDLIDGMLTLSRTTRMEMRRTRVDLSGLARTIVAELKKTAPQRQVEFVIAPDLTAHGDPNLLRSLLENLLGNAWKFTSKHDKARIELGSVQQNGRKVYFVRDDGAGFDMAYAHNLFGVFRRLHGTGEFEGTGVGLATVQRIVQRHGGRVWAEGKTEQGATFYFSLPEIGNET